MKFRLFQEDTIEYMTAQYIRLVHNSNSYYTAITTPMNKHAITSKFWQTYHFLSQHIPHAPIIIIGKVALWTVLITLIIINMNILKPQGIFSFLSILKLDNESPTTTSKTQNVLGVQKQFDLETEYHYFQTLVRNHPDYRDGFYRLALLSYQLGRNEEALEHLETVRVLDPNFPGILELETLLRE